MRRETVLKIVGLFRKNLGKGFTILEISKLLKIGYRPAYNHIADLEKIKAITTKKQPVERTPQTVLDILRNQGAQQVKRLVVKD